MKQAIKELKKVEKTLAAVDKKGHTLIAVIMQWVQEEKSYRIDIHTAEPQRIPMPPKAQQPEIDPRDKEIERLMERVEEIRKEKQEGIKSNPFPFNPNPEGKFKFV